MQNTIKNNEINKNKPDAFSESIRDKLYGHQSPIEPTAWDAIQSNLPTSNAKKNLRLFWWLSTGIAAAVALLVFVNFPIEQQEFTFSSNIQTKERVADNLISGSKQINNKRFISEQAHASTEAKNPIAENAAVQMTIPKTITQPSEKKHIVRDTDTVQHSELSQNMPISEQESMSVIQADSTLNIFTQPNIEEAHQGNTMEEQTNRENLIVEQTNQGTSIQEKPNNQKLELKKDDWTDPLKEKSVRSWELVAMVGSVGNTNSTLSAEPVFDYRPRMGIVAAERATSYIFAPEDFSDKTFSAPLSAGVAIARQVSSVLSVESGISYTYLLTTFRNNTVNSKLNLHYIGLPVRVVYSFINHTKWSFYTAAGGMVEKGLWSMYIQNQHYPTSTINTTITDKIIGWQYSLHVSAGGAYRVYKNTALYFQPNIAYYFDSNQPISIRTVTNVVVGFEGGVRYKF